MGLLNNRNDIKNLVIYLENKFPVNDWKIDDIHIWPILRIRLYLSLVYSLEKKSISKNISVFVPKPSGSFFTRIKNRCIRELEKIRLKRWIKSLPQKQFLFSGYNVQRVDFKNTRFNRFFDVYIEQEKITDKYVFIEAGEKDSMVYYKPENIFFIDQYLRLYNNGFDRKDISSNYNICLNGYFDFLMYLSNFETANDFCSNYSNLKINNLLGKIVVYYNFFNLILKKINPEKVFLLCYYSDEFLCLTAAANKLGIKTIEYQHGPQTDLHLAYSNWSNLPHSGYDMLPRVIWNWDVHSSNTINFWASKHKFYSSEVVGNFWVKYWENNPKIIGEKDFILYTLQPSPVTLEQLFPEPLIEVIKSSDFKWYIRLHPRQLQEKDEVKIILKKYNLIDKVNIETATNTPLPILLATCKIHITHFSGSSIEACQMGKFTIFINSIGAESFPDLITQKLAVFIDPLDCDFQQKLSMYINYLEK